jgi:hypothetical protein
MTEVPALADSFIGRINLATGAGSEACRSERRYHRPALVRSPKSM